MAAGKKKRLPAPLPPGEGRRKGRPAAFGDEHHAKARELYLLGDSAQSVADAIGCSRCTVQRWVKEGKWRDELSQRRNTIIQLDAEIARLAAKASRGNNPGKLNSLTKARSRVAKATPAPKPRPTVQRAVHETTLKTVLDDAYGLFLYQKEFLLSEARYRCILKARQIGFSFIMALACVLGAMAGRNQLVVSASRDQAQIVLAHARRHCERLNIPLEEDTADLLRINGCEIRALAANFRTIQGYAGDLWLDEFAWHLKPDRIWNAVLPSITQVGGRVTVCSTPFLPGNLFWKIAENDHGRWGHFERQRITIHDAIAQGMPLPGGMEELRLNFTLDAWKMFFECEYADDGSALLPWEMLQALAVEDISLYRVGRVKAGLDVGRLHDRTAIVLSGEEMDQVSGLYSGRFALFHNEQHKGLPFDAQRTLVAGLDRRHDIIEWAVDKTGLGFNLAEDLQKDMGSRVRPVWFTAQLKEKLALNLLKLAEDKKLILPNDPDFLAALHSVKKIARQSGVGYDAGRDGDGHGDLFWAAALANEGRSGISGKCEVTLF